MAASNCEWYSAEEAGKPTIAVNLPEGDNPDIVSHFPNYFNAIKSKNISNLIAHFGHGYYGTYRSAKGGPNDLTSMTHSMEFIYKVWDSGRLIYVAELTDSERPEHFEKEWRGVRVKQMQYFHDEKEPQEAIIHYGYKKFEDGKWRIVNEDVIECGMSQKVTDEMMEWERNSSKSFMNQKK